MRSVNKVVFSTALLSHSANRECHDLPYGLLRAQVIRHARVGRPEPDHHVFEDARGAHRIGDVEQSMLIAFFKDLCKDRYFVLKIRTEPRLDMGAHRHDDLNGAGVSIARFLSLVYRK